MARVLVAVLLSTAPPALADVLLDGNQHTGDEDTKTEFTPLDPVDCDKNRTYPSTFRLTQTTTITGVTLHDAVGLDNATFTVDINGTQRNALSCTACDLCEGAFSCGDVTIDLFPDITLSAGAHTIAVVDPSGASGNCNTGNDFGFTGLTLLSTETSTAVNLNQRRHVGDNNDSDDDYDFTSISGSSQFYPDAFEASQVDTLFTLTDNRRLSQVLIYRLRDVNSTDGQVLVDGNLIGTLTANGNPFTVNTNLLLFSGFHTLRIVSGTLSGQRDDQSWDDINLVFSDVTTAGTPGFFNAVDVGANLLTGSVQTKVAGGASTLDLYALNGFGLGQNTSYNGIASVELMDASNSSGAQDQYGCSSTWTVAQTLPSVIFVGGYAQVAGTFLDAGLREARIRVTDLATSAKGCSIDNFAVRPANFAVAPSHDSETTAGITTALTNTATTGTPRHKAGQPFTIVATARGAGSAAATNYDGTPTATVVAIAPATTSGTVTIDSWGAVSGGARRTDTAKYSEVGPATLTLTDSTYANVDADDTAASVRTFSGSVGAGRFTPDRFKVVEGELTPACADGFSYLGSTLNWTSAAVTLTAVNASNATTLNYAGALEKLPDDLAQPTFAAYDDPALSGTPALNTAGLPVPTISAAASGVATITLPALSFTRNLIAAFSAEIGITLPVFTDEDGILPEESPIALGSAAANSGIAFTGGATKSQRFGRLYLEPKYGSERLSLNVPLRAEYFDGVAFLPNIADATCTTLTTGDVTLESVVAGACSPATLGGQAHAVTANGGGRWTVNLSAPNVSGQACLSVDLASPGTVPYPLLRADADSDGTYAEDPATTVTFGVHSQEDRRIYQREVVGSN